MIGSQIPRIKIEPERYSTDGEGAALLMQEYGYKLDEWQQLVLDAWLGKDAAGHYNVTSAGLSVPRQNGKNVCLEAREFYGLLMNGEKILHTAHQVRTAKKSFRRLVNMFTDKHHPEIQAEVKQIKYAIGEEAIMLKNGAQIEYIARSRQGARGFDDISLLVYDEAQELTEDQAEALTSILSASSTGIRQMIYVGTPPYPGCTGNVFPNLRAAALSETGAVNKKSWHEWSIPEDSSLDVSNKKLWYETNPALGTRLTEEFTAQELATLTEDGFARERLGWWKKRETSSMQLAIDPKIWDACKSDDPKPEGKTAYGVKFTADGSEVCLCGAVIPETGKARITLIDRKPIGMGISWLVDWLNQRYRVASCVVIDGRNGVDLLCDRIASVWRFKASVIKPKTADMVAAVSLLMNELNEQNVTWYSKQESLRDSAVSATKRSIGSGWGFGGADAAPIEACALALWGAKTSKRDPRKVMRIG